MSYWNLYLGLRVNRTLTRLPSHGNLYLRFGLGKDIGGSFLFWGFRNSMRSFLTIITAALAGCNAPAPVQRPGAAEIFALRTECGKLGEAWLMRHPTARAADNTAKIYYASEPNRCWIITENTERTVIQPRSGSRSWPEWAADRRHTRYDTTNVLYDAQTGADTMTCRIMDFEPNGSYREWCKYLKVVEGSDLGPDAGSSLSGH